MTNIFAVAAQLQDFFERKQWQFCIIGGVAALHWGEPRVTRDVDVSLLTGFGGEEAFIHELLNSYRPRVENALQFAIRNRVVLLEADGGIGIDVALAALPFEQSAVSRARLQEVAPGVRLKICTPEDLIVFKAFAGRPVDWRDVEGVIARAGRSTLDWKYIEQQLTPLAQAKEEPELLRQLRDIRDRSA
jgi:hypothetical protein